MAETDATSRPGVARRLASMLYEALLLLGVLSITFLLPHILLGVFAGRAVAPWLLQAHFFLTLLAYFLWFWLHGGQTLAMKTWRLRLETRDGRPLTPSRALLRYLLAWPSVLSVAGIAWAIVDRDQQFLHDRLAATRIVRI